MTSPNESSTQTRLDQFGFSKISRFLENFRHKARRLQPHKTKTPHGLILKPPLKKNSHTILEKTDPDQSAGCANQDPTYLHIVSDEVDTT